MAGDWIKVEVVTPDKPEIFAMAEKLGIDPDAVLGKLIRAWIWADAQTVGGNANETQMKRKCNADSVTEALQKRFTCNAFSVTRAAIDRITNCHGFTDAMLEVGWLEVIENSLTFPNFERHNGKTAKSRALTHKRVSEHRIGNANETQMKRECNADSVTEALQVKRECNAASVTKALPEKRREELNTHTHSLSSDVAAERGEEEAGPELGTAAAQLGGDPLAREEYRSVRVPAKIRGNPELYAAVCRWIRHARTKITVTPDVVEAYLYEIAARPPDRAIEVINLSIPVRSVSPQLYWDKKSSLTEAKSNSAPAIIKGRGRPNPKLAEEK